ncbi:MAG: hypothetical protein JO252_18535 [Planctomycetaceae bacterium]|nr:hypothetical protein [Planctomycetaceae bacterium]
MKSLTSLQLLVLGALALFLWGHSGGLLTPPAVPPARVPAPVAVDLETQGQPEAAEGLPVPIDPGTRVTDAEIRPRDPFASGPLASAAPSPARTRNERTIAGRLSATEERALADARLQLEREVADWITPEVPAGPSTGPSNPLTTGVASTRLPYRWRVPKPLIDRLIRETRTKPIARDYGTVYEAAIVAEFSAEDRAAIIAAYQRDLVAYRLALLAGIIGFVLTCLAALAGYIRADEATRGYYTNWLRALAAVGVGASGVLIYQLLA